MMKCRYNPYELLYMYRTGDPNAFGMMMQAYGGFLMNIVESALAGNPDFEHMWEDMYQECLLGLKDAMERYREDMESSFSTFLTIVARRRLWRYLKPIVQKKLESRGKLLNLEDAVNEHECWYDILPQSNSMNDPVFCMNYNRLKEDLDHLIIDMKETDRAVLYAWMMGETYQQASARLGLSVKAYDGRIHRVKQKVRKFSALPEQRYQA